jgi:hypothetical protein
MGLTVHPYFGDIYQLKLFMTLSNSIQINRIKIRNENNMLSRFLNEWIT